MSFSSDDLASVLIAPDREFAGYGQAILTSFNLETFENEVEYRGALLTNLPVMSGTEALTYQAGDVVLLMKWKPTGQRGLGSYWIAGRPVIPASGRAEEAISFLTTSLATALSAQIFANQIMSTEILTSEARASSSYGDLATVGPTLSNITISDSGKAVVMISAVMSANPTGGGVTAGGLMSFEVSGASSVSPSDSNALSFTLQSAATSLLAARATCVRAVSGLSPGLHTFQAKYRNFGAGTSPLFGNREITVIAL